MHGYGLKGLPGLPGQGDQDMPHGGERRATGRLLAMGSLRSAS
jgi:hypothetical protein